MIKNFIFDMGNVLLKFDPESFIRRVGITDQKDIEILLKEVYKSKEWPLMDLGTLTEKEASEIMSKRVPDHLKEYVPKLTYEWDREIIPVAGAKDLVKELKENGYNIYLLSNASYNHSNYWDRVPGSEYFDGIVVSAYIKMVKPQPEIFSYTLNKFNIKAEESVFIDDTLINVEAAIKEGIHAYLFEGDFKQIREELIALGVNISK